MSNSQSMEREQTAEWRCGAQSRGRCPIADRQVRFWTGRNRSSLDKLTKLRNLVVCTFGPKSAYMN